MSRYPGVNE
jgi:hypothetical protein